MAFDLAHFINKTVGKDFIESLVKVELWKPGTRTTIDHEEIRTALKIVPRIIMALLIRELSSMKVGESKEIALPIDGAKDVRLRATKHERDVFTGDILEENKVAVDFKYRSIPGVGLVIMSAFEMYDVEQLNSHQESAKEDSSQKLQALIDERLALHDLIERVVDKKIQQRDAIKELLMAKISQNLPKPEVTVEAAPVIVIVESAKKVLPLKSFLDSRKNKNEFSVKMAKNEQVSCPDCKKNIFDGKLFSGCICLGADMDKKINIKKTEDGIKVRFGRGWDTENIEMLLEVLRSKNGV
jgi:hypothetical protein